MIAPLHNGSNALGFINSLTHTGDWTGKPFELRPWQEKIIRELFGTLTDEGIRQYKTAFIFLPRKNGKTELCAAMVVYSLFGMGTQDAEIYSAAADRAQAGRIFRAAARMIRANKALTKRCRILDSRKQIIVEATGNSFEALSADSGTKHGYNPSIVIYDELHAAKNRELYEVLETGMGTRREPLMITITTAGHDRESMEYELFDYAVKVDNGTIDDPTFYPCLYYAGDDDDWTDPAVWRKANPALGDFRSFEEMERLCKRAQAVPSQQNSFRRLYLNQHTQQDVRWLSLDDWNACECKEWPDLSKVPCYGGMDLASTHDLTALVLCWDFEGHTYVKPWFWAPQEADQRRERSAKQLLRQWDAQGHLRLTPGGVIDHEEILKDINTLADKYNIKEIGIDRQFDGTQFAVSLQKQAGITPEMFAMTINHLSPGCKKLEALMMAKQLRHDGNPVLRWNVGNVVARTDCNDNIRPEKQKSSEKIDGVVAMVIALTKSEKAKPTPSVYGLRGLLTI